jgi:hypothetical protein
MEVAALQENLRAEGIRVELPNPDDQRSPLITLAVTLAGLPAIRNLAASLTAFVARQAVSSITLNTGTHSTSFNATNITAEDILRLFSNDEPESSSIEPVDPWPRKGR